MASVCMERVKCRVKTHFIIDCFRNELNIYECRRMRLASAAFDRFVGCVIFYII